MARDRAKDQAKREIVKGRVPPSSPKFGDGGRAERTIHDRRSVDAQGSPSDAREVEQAEVQDQDNACHSNPTREDWFSCLSRNSKKQERPK